MRWLCLWFSLSQSTIDRVVAVVEQDVLTESELMAEMRLALLQRHGVEVASVTLTPEQIQVLRRYVLDQWILMAARRRFTRQDTSHEAVQQVFEQLALRFDSPSGFRAWMRRYGWSDSWLVGVLRRNMLNDKFITQRLQARLGESLRVDAETWQKEGQALLQDMEQSLRIWVAGPEGDMEPGTWK